MKITKDSANSAKNIDKNDIALDAQFMDRLSRFFERNHITIQQNPNNQLVQSMTEDTLNEKPIAPPSWKRNLHLIKKQKVVSVDTQNLNESNKKPVESDVKMIAETDYLQRIKNQQDLFRLGQSYMEDLHYGMKHFAFASIGITEEKEMTILGLALFLNQHTNNKVTIITSDFKNSFYSKYAEEFTLAMGHITETKNSNPVYTCGNIDVTQISETEFIDVLFKGTEITLWDFPVLKETNTSESTFSKLVEHTDNVTLIVKLNVTKDSDISAMEKYFSKHGIGIKGMALASE